MKKTLLFIVFAITIRSAISQDTLHWSDPPSGHFWVEEFDSEKNSWTRQEYIDSILFTTEELDSTKFYPIGSFIGYYQNGTIAFKLEHIFDGKNSELHGIKQTYYSNGNLKEEGQFLHTIKIGKWRYFSEDGSLARTTEYTVPFSDTITHSKFQENPLISKDTISIELHSFQTIWPIINFGKNGLEIIYENNSPIRMTLYENGKIIYLDERPKRKAKPISIEKRP